MTQRAFFLFLLAFVPAGYLFAPTLRQQQPTPPAPAKLVAFFSPLDTNTTIEATFTNGIVIHAVPHPVRVQLRTKYGSVWRDVTLPVTVLAGQHVRVSGLRP